jgi:hypothetical protein
MDLKSMNLDQQIQEWRMNKIWVHGSNNVNVLQRMCTLDFKCWVISSSLGEDDWLVQRRFNKAPLPLKLSSLRHIALLWQYCPGYYYIPSDMCCLLRALLEQTKDEQKVWTQWRTERYSDKRMRMIKCNIRRQVIHGHNQLSKKSFYKVLRCHHSSTIKVTSQGEWSLF